MRPPAFQFYAGDFLSDQRVALMNLAERGALITLLCHFWRTGSLPYDTGQLARLCGVDSSAMAELWLSLSLCFKQSDADPTKLIHPELTEQYKAMEIRRQERSESGKRGGNSRWGNKLHKHSSANGSAINQLLANDGSSSSSSSSSSIKNKGRAAALSGFDRFWEAWPSNGRKWGKKRCQGIWRSRRLDEKLEQILAAILSQKTSPDWTKDGGQYIPSPATWLQQERFDAPFRLMATGTDSAPTLDRPIFFGEK